MSEILEIKTHQGREKNCHYHGVEVVTYFNDGCSILPLNLYLMSLTMLKMTKMIHSMFSIFSQIKIFQIVYYFLLHLLGSRNLSPITLLFSLNIASSVT